MLITLSNIKNLLELLNDDINIKKLINIEPIGIALVEFYKAIQLDKKIDTSKNSSSTPLIQFRNEQDINKVTQDITNQILENSKLLTINDKEDLDKYLKYLISEIMDNVISHSYSTIGGCVSAKYYSEQNKVQVVIIDNGIGLLKGLSNHHSVKNEKEAIKKAMEKEVTGSNTFKTYNNIQKHAGLGLYFLSKIIEYTKGKLLIVSNDTIYNSTYEEYITINSPFRGTLVAFEIYEKELAYEFKTLHSIIRDEDKNEDEDEDIF